MCTPKLNRNELAAMIDQALLRPEETLADLRAACRIAEKYQVASLCVRPCDVPTARELLTAGNVAVGTVIAFPHGDSATPVKVCEARRAVTDGADELDMVLNITRLRSGELKYVQDEIAAVVQAARGRIVKVILECCYLNRDQMAAACTAAKKAGAQFVKTSTGFGKWGAKAEDVEFLRRQVGESMGVKAAGGIRTLADALGMIRAGASRIGTSRVEAILCELA